MHKIVFEIATIDDWYMIIKECKNWFGTDWSGQKGVRKKFQKTQWIMSSHKVWFVVPDPAFKTFMDLKMTNSLNFR